MTKEERLLALDIGEKRIGVARADTITKYPFPYTTIEVDDFVLDSLHTLIKEIEPVAIVVGYPRNQSGEPTLQTKSVEGFAAQLESFGVPIRFQDESLTSVLAENHLKSLKKPYTKADIDAYAASIILGDYLETNYA